MQTNEDQWELKKGNLRDMFIADWFHGGAPTGKVSSKVQDTK